MRLLPLILLGMVLPPAALGIVLPERPPRGYIAADHTHHLLLISFRNTETRGNLLIDISMVQVDASTACPACRAHMGFWIAADAARRVLAGSVRDFMGRYPGYRLVITGHSLGGAIATLHAAFWRSRGVETDLYTFGAPSVGNYAFAAFISDDWRGLGSNYRVTHLDDIVPKMLYRMSREPVIGLLMPEYSQSSPEYWITSVTGERVSRRDVSVIEGVNSETGSLGCLW
ncbi:lipase family protein [Aspergillus undulatus]|uniref:lipase family protein n=1 Tax=Aspergillus undulatus TaxID=1810928 RepID=UPI003CCDACC5